MIDNDILNLNNIYFPNVSKYVRFFKRLIEKLKGLFGYYLQPVRNISEYT